MDVGAGASSVPAELERMGARVIAIDYRYSNLDDLQASVNSYLQNFAVKIPQLDSRQRESVKEYIRRSHETKEQGFRERKNSKGVLFVASAGTQLPVRNNSIDFAYSEQAASRFMIEDYDIFFKSFMEVFRALKSGGQYQMHPWYSGAEHFWGMASLNMVENAGRFMYYLKSNEIEHEVFYPENQQPQIRIIKK